MFHKLKITAQSFKKTDLEIRPQYERISKIHLHGWEAWKNWFLIPMNFLDPVIFWSFFKISWIKKMSGAKKVVKLKNQFFHACQPHKIIFDICTYLGLIFIIVLPNFEQLFPNGEIFFQNNLAQIITNGYFFLSGLMCLKIQQP